MESLIAIITSICSAVAAIASVIVAILVWHSQIKQEKCAQQIALFDKRYEIYKVATKVIRMTKASLGQSDYHDNPRYLLMANFWINEYDLIKFDYLSKRNQLIHTIELGSKEGITKEDRDKADIELAILDWEVNLKLIQLKENLLIDIQPAQFCFNAEIYTRVFLLIHELFEYMMIIRDGSSIEKDRDDSALKGSLMDIEENRVVAQMQKHLSIANISQK